jgi:hypothetical protein
LITRGRRDFCWGEGQAVDGVVGRRLYLLLTGLEAGARRWSREQVVSRIRSCGRVLWAGQQEQVSGQVSV